MNTKPLINNVKERIAFLTEKVATCKERELNWNDFEDDPEVVGDGSFAKVYLVKRKSTKEIFALKSILKAKIKGPMIQQVNLELNICYSMSHPHIIKLYDHFEDDKSINLIMEFAAGGQLIDKLKEKSRFDERTTIFYMKQVLEAIYYMQNQEPKIIHRDIKPENILLDADGNAKMADFGSANRNTGLPRNTFCGTIIYMAPEIIGRNSYDESIDIWGLGILIFELLTGRTPFIEDEFSTNQEQLESNILNMNIGFPKGFPVLAQDLVSKMLKRNPQERIKIKEVMSHPWLNLQNKINSLNRKSEKSKIGPKSMSQIKMEIQAFNDVNPEKLNIFNDGSKTIQKLQSEINDSIIRFKSCSRKCDILRQVISDLKEFPDSNQNSSSKKIVKSFLHLINSKKNLSKLREELKQKRDVFHEKEKYSSGYEGVVDMMEDLKKANESIIEKIKDSELIKGTLLKDRSKLMSLLEKKAAELSNLGSIPLRQKNTIDIIIQRLKKLKIFISNLNLEETNNSISMFNKLNNLKQLIHLKKQEFDSIMKKLQEDEEEKLMDKLFEIDINYSMKSEKKYEKFQEILRGKQKRELELIKENKIAEEIYKIDKINLDSKIILCEKDIEIIKRKKEEVKASILDLEKEITKSNRLIAKLDRKNYKGNI